MVQRGYVQRYVCTRECREPILPPVMSAPMPEECQVLAANGHHRGARPNAAKATMESYDAKIGARWKRRTEPKHQQPHCKSYSLHARPPWYEEHIRKNPDQPLGVLGRG